jgi:hypothetical protein
MKRIVPLRLAAPLLFVCLLLLFSTGAFAQVVAAPSLLNFQGRLTRPDGTPVANGNYSVRFSLWTAASGGTEKWNQTINPVAVTNGTFAVLLNVASPTDLFNTNLWLEIKIGTNAPLTPRQQLVSVAYAMKANTVPDGSITSAKIASGALNNLSWLLSGNSLSNPASQFLGTTNNQPLVFRANNSEKMRILPNGNIGIGEPNPTSQVTINSNLGGGISLGTAAGIAIGNPAGNTTILMGQDDGKGVYYGWLLDSYAYMFTINGQPLVLQQFPGNVGIGTNVPDGKAHIAGGPTWTTNGWAKSLAINNGGAIELGYGLDAPRFGLGASGGGLYLFTVGSEGAVDPANYRLVVNGNNGNIGIGTTNPGEKLDVVGTVRAFTSTSVNGVQAESTWANGNGVVGICNNGTSAYGVWGQSTTGWGVRSNGAAGGTSGWANLSDARYKTNVTPLSNALDSILNLRGVTFDWKRNDFPDMNFAKGRQIGFIAQEVEKILPELVMTDGTGYKSVTYSSAVPVLVEAIKTLKQQSDRKDAEMSALKAENAEMRARFADLLQRMERLEAGTGRK